VPEAVAVIEDDPFVRKGIVAQIRSDPAFEVVAEAADVATARAAIESGKATIGVFDLQLRDGTTLSLIPLAVERGMSVLVLTVWDDDDSVYQALAAGAGGYLLKGDASAGRVSEALKVLKEGGAPISPMIARRLLDDLRLRAPRGDRAPAPAQPQSADLSSLTDREREIIELFAKGSTYEEVAAMLEMSVNTVRHHVRSMYRKLHVCSKAEAVTVAYRLT
jgi:DNA-binding NarL/FixJ family response regulator